MKFLSNAPEFNSHFITNAVIVVRAQPATHFPIFELSQNNCLIFFYIIDYFDQKLKSAGMEQNKSKRLDFFLINNKNLKILQIVKLVG